MRLVAWLNERLWGHPLKARWDWDLSRQIDRETAERVRRELTARELRANLDELRIEAGLDPREEGEREPRSS